MNDQRLENGPLSSVAPRRRRGFRPVPLRLLLPNIVTLIALCLGMTAIRLAIGMTSLQVSIGTLNDLVDAPRDAGRKPGKPIPAGIVSPRAARIVVVAAGILGVALSVPSSPALAVLAVVVLTIGANEGACEECLVPKSLFLQMVRDEIAAAGEKVDGIDVVYPVDRKTS